MKLETLANIVFGLCVAAIVFLVVFGVLVATDVVETRWDREQDLRDRIERLERGP